MMRKDSEIELPFSLSGEEEMICYASISPRAHYLRLKISIDSRICMSVPRGVSRENMIRFLEEQKPWIRRTLGTMKLRASAERKNDPAVFPDTLEFGFYDVVFHTEYVWRDVCWQGARLDRERGVLEFSGSVLDRALTAETFALLLKRTAAKEFPPMLDALSAKTGIPYEQCLIRLQSSRWGSCSREKHISLNALLLLFPKELTEYVMIHELCHLRQMNHSAKFWQEVARYVPDWQMRRKLLNSRAKALPKLLRSLS